MQKEKIEMKLRRMDKEMLFMIWNDHCNACGNFDDYVYISGYVDELDLSKDNYENIKNSIKSREIFKYIHPGYFNGRGTYEIIKDKKDTGPVDFKILAEWLIDNKLEYLEDL